MSLLVPIGLGLAATLPVVVLFYLLKVRRVDQEVGSTFLWSDQLQDLAAHEPFQRLKPSVLLAIQLIALGLLSLALARPFLRVVGPPPVQAVLVLDGSASMQARDVTPSRFAAAVASARRLLAELPEQSVASLILAETHPRILAAPTDDRRAIELALDGAQPTGEASDIREALILARSLAGEPQQRRIHLLTDLAFPSPTDLPEDLGSVEVDRVGTSSAGNVAITAFAARPDPRDNRRRQLFARVENLGPPATVSLTLEVDNRQTDVRQLDVDADAAIELTFEDLPQAARAARLALGPVAGENALTLDDEAFSVLAPRKATQVLLVTPGNVFLEKGLSLLPGVELYEIQARRYLATEAERYDVVVFDDYLPPLLPRANLLVVNPPERGLFRSLGDMRRPRVATWDRDAPVLAFVDVRELSIGTLRRMELPRWAKALAATQDGTPVIAAGQEGERRVVVLPFDLVDSNLPLVPSFPILLANTLAYLSPSGVVEDSEVPIGGTIRFTPLLNATRVRVLTPDSVNVELAAGGGPLTYGPLQRPGLYRVQQLTASGELAADEGIFAVNALNREESDVRPRAILPERELAASVDPVPLPREVWAALAGVALLLVLGEWAWFNRRT